MNAASATVWLTENRDGAKAVKGGLEKQGRSRLAEADRNGSPAADRNGRPAADGDGMAEADQSRLAEADRSRLADADRGGADARVPTALPPSAGLG
jgi:hypothetical protein